MDVHLPPLGGVGEGSRVVSVGASDIIDIGSKFSFFNQLTFKTKWENFLYGAMEPEP